MSPGELDRIVAAVLTAGVMASWAETMVPTEDGPMVSAGPGPVQPTEAGVRRVLGFYRCMLGYVQRAHVADRLGGSDGDHPA
jgi:hypothetical protein